jgi:anhydro-N-acetylmuramic acid kinase
MSGSSLDGLDMAYCTFDNSSGNIKWSIVDAQIIHFSADWMNIIRKAPSMSGKDLMKLDAELGIYIGHAVKQWMDEKKLYPDLIASHGHTIFHEPLQHFTTQIGSGPHIATITGVDTINNFRQADVAAGGQGAPFAPIADRDLFSGYTGYLNLGGIANFSIELMDQKWKAWDICPCNQALNFLAEKKGMRYDENGLLAASGKVNAELLEKLKLIFTANAQEKPSLSNATVQNTWLDLLSNSIETTEDLLATTVQAIAQLINEHISSAQKREARILVTGGGAHNSFMMQQLNAIGSENSISFEKPDNLIIDFKESLLMAYLGYLSFNHLPFGISAITGAGRDVIGGSFHKSN